MACVVLCVDKVAGDSSDSIDSGGRGPQRKPNVPDTYDVL